MPQMAGTEIYPESKIIEILHLSEAQIQALHNMPRMTHFYWKSRNHVRPRRSQSRIEDPLSCSAGVGRDPVRIVAFGAARRSLRS